MQNAPRHTHTGWILDVCCLAGSPAVLFKEAVEYLGGRAYPAEVGYWE